MKIFELSQQFPSEEKYSLTDQIRRSSRSVCANLAEAWRGERLRRGGRLEDKEDVLAPLSPCPPCHPCLLL